MTLEFAHNEATRRTKVLGTIHFVYRVYGSDPADGYIVTARTLENAELVNVFHPTKYSIHFVAREKGALGTHSSYVREVAADDPKAAVLKLYDDFEHVLVRTISPVNPQQ